MKPLQLWGGVECTVNRIRAPITINSIAVGTAVVSVTWTESQS